MTSEGLPEAIRQARLRLLEVAERGTLAEVLRATLDELEELSGSCIGFCHFLEKDQNTLTLQAWSTRTARDYCKASGEGSHYPLASAGVWADAVRLRRPLIHNDYASLPERKGMPEGHARLVRELVVPVLRGERVTAVLGVGNKASDYTEEDLRTVGMFADLAWEIADNMRIRETLQFEEAALEYSLAGVALAHLDGRIRYVNPAYVALRGHQDRYRCLGLDLWAFWADPAVAAALRGRLLADGKPVEGEMLALQYDGTPFTAHFTASLAKDALGNPLGILGTFLDETERKQAERALQEREFFFKESQRAAAIGSYKADFRLGRWQSSAVLDQLFGIDAGYDRSIPNWLQIVHPEDRDMMGRYLAEEVIAKRQPFRKEYRIQRIDDRETRWVNGLGEVSYDADGNVLSLIGTIQDITERRETQRFNDQIIRCAQEGIIVYGSDLTYQVWNPHMERLTGVPASKVLGRHPKDLFPFLEETGVLAQLERVLAGAPAETLEFPFHVAMTGAAGWSSNTSGPLLNASGEIIGVIATVRDITQARRLEEETRRNQAERAELERQLHQVQKLESLGSLAGGVAHDMNNVLGAILSLASAHVALQPAGSPVHQALETILEAATRGGKMVQSLLTFARNQPAEERQVDLNAVLGRDLALLEHTTLAKVRLVTDFAPDLKPILGDAGALVSAFMNLCVNAVDAMPQDGVLTLRTRNTASGLAEVEIEDTGVGMPPEVLAKALDPFFTTKETGKGTGLGLSMVYSTVKAHHGQFELHSVVGQGTRARMVFPVCEPAEPQAPAAVEVRPSRPGGLRLLLVDDDELIRKATTMLIEILGHEVVSANSGEEALQRLQGGFGPDAVILDMNMPGLGGAGTLPRLRALCPDLPVLLATGRVDEAALSLVEAHPGVVLMAKPFTIEDLQAHLDRIHHCPGL